MKRVIVLGGRGLFGRTVVEQLGALGIKSLVAGRRQPADIVVDAEDGASIRGAIAAGDLVIGTAGPFQKRSTALIHAAVEVGFDVIDINDNLRYVQQVLALESRIARTGIRVLSSASSVSALAAAMVMRSEIGQPVSVTSFLAPASRHTANRGSALSLIESIGEPVLVFRDGKLQSRQGWSEHRRFGMPKPLGTICGGLFESADAVYLPRAWPSLRCVEMYVDTNTTGVNTLLRAAARIPGLRRLMIRRIDFAVRAAKVFGSKVGGIGYEIEDAGKYVRLAALSAENSFVVAVAPAVLAAQAIVQEKFSVSGLILPHQQVQPGELWSFLQSRGIEIVHF